MFDRVVCRVVRVVTLPSLVALRRDALRDLLLRPVAIPQSLSLCTFLLEVRAARPHFSNSGRDACAPRLVRDPNSEPVPTVQNDRVRTVSGAVWPWRVVVQKYRKESGWLVPASSLYSE